MWLSREINASQGQILSMMCNSYSVAEDGNELLTSPTPVPLPCESHKPIQACTSAIADMVINIKLTRKRKGTHLLPTLTKLLSSRENWYDIKNTEDYQYPGRFKSALPRSLRSSPHFPSTARTMNTFCSATFRLERANSELHVK